MHRAVVAPRPTLSRVGLPQEGRRALTAARRALRSSGYRALVRLNCEWVEGKLRLRGSVPSFHLKQMAQEVVLRLRLAAELENHVEVI